VYSNWSEKSFIHANHRFLKPCPHWRLQSPISATIVAGNSCRKWRQFAADRFWRQSPKAATVAKFGDCSRQCGQGFKIIVSSKSRFIHHNCLLFNVEKLFLYNCDHCISVPFGISRAVTPAALRSLRLIIPACVHLHYVHLVCVILSAELRQ